MGQASRRAPGEVIGLARDVAELVGALASDALVLHQRRSASRSIAVAPFPRSRQLGGGRPSGHSDPVGDAVANVDEAFTEGRSAAGRAYAEVAIAIEAAVILLRDAEKIADAVLRPHPVAKADDDVVEGQLAVAGDRVGCTSHAFHGYRGVPARTPGSDLCRWCADFWRRYRQRPSKTDLEQLEERRVRSTSGTARGGDHRRAA